MMNAQHTVDSNKSSDSNDALGAPQPDCQAIQALIPDYAFSLTDTTETQWIERHLAECADAASVLADFRQMAALMRTDLPQIAPPPQLGERLMALAAITAPTTRPPAFTESIPGSAPALPVTAKPPRLNRWPWLLAAAVIVLVLSNAYWLVRFNGIGAAIGPNPTAAPNAAVGLVVNTTSTLRWVHLPASEQSGKASAYLMWNAESKIGLLYVHDFPVLAAGQTYQLWLTHGAAHLSVGTFTVDQNGKGALLFSTETIDQYTWARITTEPQSGSDAPNGIVVVVGQL